VGLDDIRSVEQVTQEIRFNLAVFFLPLYCGLFLTGLYIVTRYKIDRKGHVENLVELSERHKEEAPPPSLQA
jgi:Na+/melibiose symporter-like transporter